MFQTNLIPTVNNMQIRTTENGLKAAGLSLIFVFLIYTGLSILAIYMYGSSIQSDIMKNVGSSNWAGVTISISFLIVLICHVPFVYFACKEAALIIVDELDRKAISQALNELLQRVRDENSAQSPGSAKVSSNLICFLKLNSCQFQKRI